MTPAAARRLKIAARALLMGAGACCLALVPQIPAWAIPLTIGGVMLPAVAASVGVGEMNAPKGGGDVP